MSNSLSFSDKNYCIASLFMPIPLRSTYLYFALILNLTTFSFIILVILDKYDKNNLKNDKDFD